MKRVSYTLYKNEFTPQFIESLEKYRCPNIWYAITYNSPTRLTLVLHMDNVRYIQEMMLAA
jgi:hypothetical protein